MRSLRSSPAPCATRNRSATSSAVNGEPARARRAESASGPSYSRGSPASFATPPLFGRRTMRAVLNATRGPVVLHCHDPDSPFALFGTRSGGSWAERSSLPPEWRPCRGLLLLEPLVHVRLGPIPHHGVPFTHHAPRARLAAP